MDDAAISISLTPDNGYVLTGRYNDSFSHAVNGSAFILKTDSEGNQQWMKEFSNCTLYSVKRTSDGGYIAAGVKNKHAWLVKLAGDEKYVENKVSSIEYNDTADSIFSQIFNYIYSILPVGLRF